MPVHNRILEIETFQVADSCRLDLLWKTKMATQRCDFGDVQFDEEMFFLGINKLDI